MDRPISIENMQEMFESYYRNNSHWILHRLDLTKGGEYNAYLDDRTGLAFCWFIFGAMQYRQENNFDERLYRTTI